MAPTIRTRVRTSTHGITFRHGVTVSIDILDLNMDDLQDALSQGGEDAVVAAVTQAIDAQGMHARLWNWIGARAITDSILRYAALHTPGSVPESKGIADDGSVGGPPPAGLPPEDTENQDLGG